MGTRELQQRTLGSFADPQADGDDGGDTTADPWDFDDYGPTGDEPLPRREIDGEIGGYMRRARSHGICLECWHEADAVDLGYAHHPDDRIRPDVWKRERKRLEVNVGPHDTTPPTGR